MKTTYQQWRLFLASVAAGATAELQGYTDAETRYDAPLVYREASLQSRYEQGFCDGKQKLAAEEALK